MDLNRPDVRRLEIWDGGVVVGRQKTGAPFGATGLRLGARRDAHDACANLCAVSSSGVAHNTASLAHWDGAAFADIAAGGHGSTAGTRVGTFPALAVADEDAIGAGTELTVRIPAEISLAS
jgi:hypothetical protein